ncbi:MAG TPA: YbaN family protein [Burkholderiales bacterium]|nr:YbaN family protein [Burkholderiales bacterium]
MTESPGDRRRRLPYIVLAYVCVGLGAAGVVLPLLPTTPFLIVAAWAASRGSPRLDAWLHGHPRFGPSLCAWRDERAVPTRAKVIACTLMLMSWLIMLFVTSSPWVPAITGVLFLCVGTYVCTRPAPGMRRTP